MGIIDQMQLPPIESLELLQWLTDRAEIADLMAEYTRCLDTKDFEGQARLFAEDGYLELPFATFTKAALPTPQHTEVLGQYAALQHQISSQITEVTGETAHLRCNFEAVHVHGEVSDLGGSQHGTVGGVYEVTFRKEDGRWRLVVVKTTFLWSAGELLHG